jgi:SAM-dependent methyltransferase
VENSRSPQTPPDRNIGVSEIGTKASELCLLCGGRDFTSLVVPEVVTMLRCRECGLWVNADLTGGSTPSDQYAIPYHENYRRHARRKMRTALLDVTLLEARHARGRLLDVGCSLGYFVEAACARGWDAYGVDVAEDVVAACCQRGLRVELGTMGRLPFPDKYFDVVQARHVLEHDVEVWRNLAEMRRVLADDGLLIVLVPDGDCAKVRRRGARYRRFWIAAHLLCFTRPTLTAVMQRAGFREVAPPAISGRGPGEWLRAPALLGWQLLQGLKARLGLDNTLRTAWRKSDA